MKYLIFLALLLPALLLGCLTQPETHVHEIDGGKITLDSNGVDTIIIKDGKHLPPLDPWP